MNAATWTRTAKHLLVLSLCAALLLSNGLFPHALGQTPSENSAQAPGSLNHHAT